MLLPRLIYKYIILFSICFILGILFANTVLVFLSIVPFLLFISDMFLKVPEGFEVHRDVGRERFFTDDEVDVSIAVSIESGIGMFFIADVLPEGVKLVNGNNFAVLWKGFGRKSAVLRYSVRFLNPGNVAFDTITIEARHPVFGFARQNKVSAPCNVTVVPRVFYQGELSSIPMISRIPMPLDARTTTGIPTLEFKEIRQYTYGDSFKFVNWKASSRNIYRGSIWPVINEYEKEGKKTVWILMDGSKAMTYGNSIKKVFNYALEAVCQLSNYYIKQQCSTGFVTYNTEKVFVSPDTGEKQYHRILGEVLGLSGIMEKKVMPKNNFDLKDAVTAYRGYVRMAKPLFVVITSFMKMNYEEIESGIKELRKYTANFSGHHQVMVVNIVGFGIESENEANEMASEILNIENKIKTAELRKKCIWIDWNPVRQSLFKAIVGQVPV